MIGDEATSPAPTPTAATPVHRVLTPSRSIRSNLDQQLPTTPTPKEKTGTSKSLLKSPGSPGFWHYNHGQTGSPRPIPMHEGMKSNASARKGRRLTVENDLERLRGELHEEFMEMIRSIERYEVLTCLAFDSRFEQGGRGQTLVYARGEMIRLRLFWGFTNARRMSRLVVYGRSVLVFRSKLYVWIRWFTKRRCTLCPVRRHTVQIPVLSMAPSLFRCGTLRLRASGERDR